MKQSVFGICVVSAALVLMGANVKVAPKGHDSSSRGTSAPAVSGRGVKRNVSVRGTSRSRAHSPPVVIKMQRRTIPQPRVIKSKNIVRDRPTVTWPRRDDRGVVIEKKMTTIAPRHHTTVVRNTTVVNHIHSRRRVEVVPNRHYWHTVGGVRYCHYYHGKHHWYGFYHGPTFYWTRHYNGYWWWFDVRFNRWVYWWDGYWWWPGPGSALYVYVDNNYYPYHQGVVTVVKPEVQPPPEQEPASGDGITVISPDNARLVQIVGAQSEAFLYDNSSSKPVYMKYLGQGVDNARFSGGGEKPLQILLDFKDGNFALFNAEGDPQDSSDELTDAPSPVSAPPDVDPPPDADLPPVPPSSAP